MQCLSCRRILVQPLGRGRRRKFCGAACKMRHARTTPAPPLPHFPVVPVWHHGRFEDYQAAYAGKVQVIITDPPYGKKHLPIYAALVRFAGTVLAPKGFLLCMCGWEELREVLNLFADSTLHYLSVVSYILEGHGGQGRRPETQHVWRRHHKAVLWYQQPGPKAVRRRSGTTDVLVVSEPSGTEMDKARFKWEQSLAGFRQLVDLYTNNEDVICDPMMGTGTTLLAAVSMHRPRVIGIEQHAGTYALAHARLTEAGLVPGGEVPGGLSPRAR
jgi:hypothetical protein